MLTHLHPATILVIPPSLQHLWERYVVNSSDGCHSLKRSQKIYKDLGPLTDDCRWGLVQGDAGPCRPIHVCANHYPYSYVVISRFFRTLEIPGAHTTYIMNHYEHYGGEWSIEILHRDAESHLACAQVDSDRFLDPKNAEMLKCMSPRESGTPRALGGPGWGVGWPCMTYPDFAVVMIRDNSWYVVMCWATNGNHERKIMKNDNGDRITVDRFAG